MSRELVQSFNYGNNETPIRTIVKDGRVWFVGKDIAEELGYERTADAIRFHCKGSAKHRLLTEGGMQEMTIIPESDVYRLVMHSKLPAAEKFEEWVVAEVLPAIRKTGYYGTPKSYQREIAAFELFPKAYGTAKRLGMNRNRTAFAANDAVKQITGVDILGLMNITLLPEEDPINSTLLNGLVQLMDADNVTIKGTFKDIIERLAVIVEPDSNDFRFPTPHTFRNQMERLRPNLSEMGIVFEFGTKHTNRGQTIELIKRPPPVEAMPHEDDCMAGDCPDVAVQ
jgi:prophage antirepressor-like protein